MKIQSNVDHLQQSLTALSLCTGIRGLERGVERVVGPLRTIAYVEIEAFIIENLLAGMEAGLVASVPIWANLKTFPWYYFRHKIFLLLGGYPCQPFSTAGKRGGASDPRHLWPHIEFGIRTTRPVCCFFENVAGHLSLGFEQVALSLRAMGYAIEAGIYTAEEVGAPHRRARLFILGILDDAKGSLWGLYERSRKSGETTPDAAGTGKMGDAESDNERRKWQFAEGFQEPPGRSGPDVADAGSAERRSNDSRRCGYYESDIQKWHKKATGSEEYSQEMVYTDFFGQQFGEPSRMGGGSQSSAWPARPGQSQYIWEHSRILESSLGCTVDGYNFREDLLRALGNGVVEQTAEFAFRDLLRKHFE